MDTDSKVGVVVFGGLILFMVFVIWAQKRAESRCEQRGGVYLFREGKCVTGIKELK